MTTLQSAQSTLSTYTYLMDHHLRDHRHSNYSTTPGIISIAARDAARALGGNYKRKLYPYLEVVDDEYCIGKRDRIGVSKAYRLDMKKIEEELEPRILEYLDLYPNLAREIDGHDRADKHLLSASGLQSAIDSRPRIEVLLRVIQHHAIDNGDGTLTLKTFYRKSRCGRMVACSPSIQNIPRRIRQQLLAGTDQVDVDMKNSVPIDLWALAKEAAAPHWVMKEIKDYINNKEMVLEILVEMGLVKSRSAAKSEYIAGMTGGGTIREGFKDIKRAMKELETILTAAQRRPPPTVKAMIESLQDGTELPLFKPGYEGLDTDNWRSRLFTHAFVRETECLDWFMKQAEKRGHQAGGRMYDGFLMGGAPAQATIDQMNDMFEDEHGYRKELVIKERFYE